MGERSQKTNCSGISGFSDCLTLVLIVVYADIWNSVLCIYRLTRKLGICRGNITQCLLVVLL